MGLCTLNVDLSLRVACSNPIYPHRLRSVTSAFPAYPFWFDWSLCSFRVYC